MLYNSLIERSLDLAAGTGVDPEAYSRWPLNLAKLQSLGRCYREGWLHNVLQRITPLTVREMNDYLMMADLFILTRRQADELLAQYGRDLTTFATQAGLLPDETTRELRGHMAMYRELGNVLAQKFGLNVPKPFASTTLSAGQMSDMPFIRTYMQQFRDQPEDQLQQWAIRHAD